MSLHIFKTCNEYNKIYSKEIVKWFIDELLVLGPVICIRSWLTKDSIVKLSKYASLITKSIKSKNWLVNLLTIY